ncbi:hypothetical protein ACLB2K_075140 [Fragaria x ananassa]
MTRLVTKHKSGAENKGADALSRVIYLLSSIALQVVGFDLLKRDYSSCKDFSSLYADLAAGHGREHEMLPKGTRSLLVQPVMDVLHPSDSGNEKIQGFVLLASSMRYAYSDKDRVWARALAKKFRGK